MSLPNDILELHSVMENKVTFAWVGGALPRLVVARTWWKQQGCPMSLKVDVGAQP